MNLVREILAAALIALGLLCYVIEVIGVFRFDYVLNRMHAAAIGDSVGLLFMGAGCMVLFWDLFPVLKIALVLLSVWLTSPISAHQIARIEMLTNPRLVEHLTGQDLSAKEEDV